MLYLCRVNDGMFYESLYDLFSGLKGLGCMLDLGFRDLDLILIVFFFVFKYKIVLVICLVEFK